MKVRTIFKKAAEKAVREKGGKLTVIKNTPLTLKFEFPDGVTFQTHGGRIPLNLIVSSKIMIDKQATGVLLKSEHIHSPRTLSIKLNAKNFPSTRALEESKSYQRAVRFIDRVNLPVYLKPNSGSQGRNVYRIDQIDILNKLLPRLIERKTDDFLIQEACSGKEYRIIAIRGKIQLAIEKRPLSVVGDGHSTVKSLIENKLAVLKKRGRSVSIKPHSAKITTHLKHQGLTLQSILPAGQHITVLSNKNLSDGGTAHPCTEEIRKKYSELVHKICDRLDIGYCGIDLIEDTRKKQTRPYIIELNGSPGFRHFVHSAPENAAELKRVFVAAFRAAHQIRKEVRRPAALQNNSASITPEKVS